MRWFELAPWLGFVGVGAWLVKDVVMFPFVRSAFEPHGRGGAKDLLGASGTAEEPLSPAGYVRIGHELWRARLADADGEVAGGERVEVVAVDGLTLEVRPAPNPERAHRGSGADR